MDGFSGCGHLGADAFKAIVREGDGPGSGGLAVVVDLLEANRAGFAHCAVESKRVVHARPARGVDERSQQLVALGCRIAAAEEDADGSAADLSFEVPLRAV